MFTGNVPELSSMSCACFPFNSLIHNPGLLDDTHAALQVQKRNFVETDARGRVKIDSRRSRLPADRSTKIDICQREHVSSISIK